MTYKLPVSVLVVIYAEDMNRAVLSPTACAEVETPVLLFQSGRDNGL